MLIAFLDGISKNIGKVVEKATDIVVNFLDGIGKTLPRIIQAGFDLLIAFIDGMTEAIEKNTPVVIESVKRLGQAMLDAAVAILLDPLKGALDIGKNVVLGLIEGIKNKAEEAVGAITDLGSDILEGIQNFFKMRSPSRVMKDEVGRYIVQGIAEGITADMSAEQAAEKKAQNILNAFKDALGSIDISSNRLDLEYQLWAESNPNAAKGEKVARQLSLLNEKLANQQEKVNLAAAEYQTMVDNLGEASDQTKSAYNRYLQEKISLVQVSNAITELDKDATASYFDFLVKNGKEMQKMGYTAEQIEAEARKRTGYGYDPVSKAMVESVEKSVSGAMKTVTTVYEQSATKTFGTLVGNFDQWGSDYANAIGDGFLKSFQFVLTKIRTALDGMDREVNNRLARMVERIKVAMQNLDSALTISPVVDMTGLEPDKSNKH